MVKNNIRNMEKKVDNREDIIVKLSNKGIFAFLIKKTNGLCFVSNRLKSVVIVLYLSTG